MKKLNELTSEHKAIMLETRDYWLNLALKENGKGIDKEKHEKGINFLYEELLKKPKPIIVYCDSWISAVITISMIKEFFKNKETLTSINDSILDSVRNSVSAFVRDSVSASVLDSVSTSVSASTRASVWDSVRDYIWDSINDSVRDSIRDSIINSVWGSVRSSVWDSVCTSIRDSFNDYSTYTGFSDYGWVSFYDFFTKIGIINNDNFNKYNELCQANSFQNYFYENIVFSIQPPVVITKNDNGVLHDNKKYAIEFRDGSGYYYINGRSCPEHIFNEAKTLTKERFISEENEDYKAMWYEILGQEKMMEILGAKMIDSGMFVHENGELETVELYKTTEKIEGVDDYMAWVKFICPSTGSSYLIDVEPRFKSATKAAISTSPFYGMEINNINDYKFAERS
jgi:hypothetical protein